jgi:hypothetical protein
MAKHTVYTPDGKAVEMEPVDARECVTHCGYSYIPPRPELVAEHDRWVICRGFPNNAVDAGELGLIQFDESGVALVTPEQAKWLDDGIAVGLLGEPKVESGTLTALNDEAAVFKPLPEFDGQAERVSEPAGENTLRPMPTDGTTDHGTAATSAGDPAEAPAADVKPAKAKK